jgi:hypothetical protein
MDRNKESLNGLRNCCREIDLNELIDHFGFANRCHFLRQCVAALEEAKNSGVTLKWPIRFETIKK